MLRYECQAKVLLTTNFAATGGIATTFTKDLTVDPKTRGVNDLIHTIVAAASSSSVERAKDFLKEVGASSEAKAYGSYDELVKDPNIDIIYVATPHSHHYQCARKCLEAGKNVLCEKAFTVNAAQTKKLVQIAKEKNLFLMEAVWTRYFPLSKYVRDLVSGGTLGDVSRVFADLSMNANPYEAMKDGKHRLVNMNLAGGAMLDLGIYALTWCFQTLYTTQQKGSNRQKPTVVGKMKPHTLTGSDEQTSMIITFPGASARGNDAQGIATCSIVTNTDPDSTNTTVPAIRVQGTKGEVQVFAPAYRPTKTRLVLSDGTIDDKTWTQPGPGKGSGFHNGFGQSQHIEGEGHGMFWEADEAGRALVEGRKEGSLLGLEESVLIMEIMDEVRKQNGMKYPSDIETLDYPVTL